MQKISPCLWFDGNAEEAAEFYVSIFDDSRILNVSRYPDGSPMAGTALVVDFEIEGTSFQALNGGPQFSFTEAISFVTKPQTQEQVDFLWDSLIGDSGEPSQCGWLKDKFGVSWQVVPQTLLDLLSDPDPAKAGRVMQAMLAMSKIDIPTLERAAAGESVDAG
jgi:predicted 3-demethylubiquinone-9 3-methyltransferase (glyoxalase superfamily)